MESSFMLLQLIAFTQFHRVSTDFFLNLSFHQPSVRFGSGCWVIPPAISWNTTKELIFELEAGVNVTIGAEVRPFQNSARKMSTTQVRMRMKMRPFKKRQKSWRREKCALWRNFPKFLADIFVSLIGVHSDLNPSYLFLLVHHPPNRSFQCNLLQWKPQPEDYSRATGMRVLNNKTNSSQVSRGRMGGVGSFRDSTKIFHP